MMRLRGMNRMIAGGTGILVLALVAGSQADVVNLHQAGAIRGKVVTPRTKSVPQVVVKTQTGATIAIDRQGVRSIEKQSGAENASHDSPRLSEQQQAWMPRVRKLIERLESADVRRSADARSELLKIEDVEALPALQKHLANHVDERVRRLFVAIAKYFPGFAPVPSLAHLSLGDQSPLVRDDAIQAIGGDRAKFARPFYVAALTLRGTAVAERAAIALRDLGDPEHEGVANMIDNLTYMSRMRTVGPQQARALIEADPGLPPATYQRLSFSVSSPAYGDVSAVPSLGFDGRSTLRPESSDRRSRSYGCMYGSHCICARDVLIRSYRPAIHDSLVKITGKDFGTDTDAWRKWLASEQRDREARAASAR